MIEVLLVEDNPGDARLVEEFLKRDAPGQFNVTRVARLSEALTRLARQKYGAILLDLFLPDISGLDALRPLQAQAADTPVIVLSGLQDEATAIQSVRAGAQDYLVKGRSDGTRIARGLRYAIERKRTEREIRRLAEHDSLTGLPNRRLLVDRLQQAIAFARRHRGMLAVLYFDLDHFKEVNDRHGHAAGDLLLVSVTERLRATLRESDTLARLGGDEFCVILPEVARVDDVLRTAGKMFEALAAPFPIGQAIVRVSPSMGIGLYPKDGGDAETLLALADEAMYQAKRRGGNIYELHTPAPLLRRPDRGALAADLRLALERDEIILHYLPEIDLPSGHVTALEALARWKHPEHGLLEASEFIAAAEETRLMVPLEERTLRLACAQIGAWRAQGLVCPRVDLNVSAAHVGRDEYPETLKRALDACGLGATSLGLEVNAASLSRNRDAAARTLPRLKAFGLTLAIDDFVAGYDLLGDSRRIPIDIIKIDQTVIDAVGARADSATIAGAIIGMARGLGLQPVAEGVETSAQRDALLERGCVRMQGYLFSRALPVEEVTRLLRNGARWEPALAAPTVPEPAVPRPRPAPAEGPAGTDP
jgi:diguanylate cyclase (GGDEF)-like protein